MDVVIVEDVEDVFVIGVTVSVSSSVSKIIVVRECEVGIFAWRLFVCGDDGAIGVRDIMRGDDEDEEFELLIEVVPELLPMDGELRVLPG